MKKINVPDGMLKAAIQAFFTTASLTGKANVGDHDRIAFALEAALLWLSEHPQVPTDEQAKQLRDLGKEVAGQYDTQLHTAASAAAIAVEWQRRCFQEEEPEMEKDLSDLTIAFDVSHKVGKLAIDAIQEAYRRGLRKRGE